MKILVIQQKMIGDVLTSSVLFEALRQKYPNAQLDYLINEHTLPVVENNPFIDNFVLFTQKEEESKIALLKFAWNTRKEHYDVLIDVYSKLTSFLICFISGAKTKISYYKSYSKSLYHHNVIRKEKTSSTDNLAIIHRLDLLKPLGIEKKNIIPKIYLSEKELVNAKAYLESNNISLAGPIYMVSALGSSANKTYPFQFMAEVIDKIAQEKPKSQILFNYLPHQKEEAISIFNLCKPETQALIHLNVFGKSLRSFLGILKYCSALIGNEGGAANMAKALHVRTFSIFSPWIDKATWNLYENEDNMSVHLKDYKPNLYTQPEKLYKGESLNFYEKFTPDLFIDKLHLFLNTNHASPIIKEPKELQHPKRIKQPKVSALLITYNESKHIDEVIENLSFADEIIVVDSYSNDGTLDKLSKYKHVKTICRPFINFADQRNFALQQATHDWIIFIDADERISRNLQKELIKEINKPSNYVAFQVKRIYYFKNKRIRFSGFQTDATYRIFKKDSVKYIEEKIVHEMPEINGMSKLLKNTMPHYCFESAEQYKSKMEHYATLKAIELSKEGIKPNFFHFYLRPAYKFIFNYILRLGILDGKEGYSICVLSAYGVYFRYQELKKLNKKR
ncbi:glycosyltransferase [Cognatitamlana onchidii]|uniref:glycosyltransferase n=1 Tax=Cognatitamlana onchidii TaxID=2562860 RepID=UPI00145616D5|nr:glycosyltransferase [Algibacter onchidii]